MSNIKEDLLINNYPSPISINEIEQILFQMKNCICRININEDRKGIGFFCKISFHDNYLPVLISNYLALNENDNVINLTINNKEKKIKLDNSRIKYINYDLDISIIEIKPNKDKIYNYLEIDENLINDAYKHKPIYMIHYPNKTVVVSFGIIHNVIDNKIINHYCQVEEGSTGSAILSLQTFKVIGIHYSQKNKINIGKLIKNMIDEFNRNKNKINIIYKANKEDEVTIFGEKFVENNKNNIELIINGNKNYLISRYKLKKGENNIKIILKNKIKNLEYMFYKCKSLKNIKELEYLDTRDVSNFDWMFCGCSSLSDIKGLQNWNVSNGKNFSYMFCGCSSLSDIKGLQNWNVMNGNDFSYMFSECSSLEDIKPLENWNILNGNNFSYMFHSCSSLKDIKPLENWNILNGNNLIGMFSGCSLLSNIKELLNWNVSNGTNFYGIYDQSDSKSLNNWKKSDEIISDEFSTEADNKGIAKFYNQALGVKI